VLEKVSKYTYLFLPAAMNNYTTTQT